jgi:carboxymethylenebutenolidase
MDKSMTEQANANIWGEHLRQEFGQRDAAAAVATMTDDASVTYVAMGLVAKGREEVLKLYRDVFIPGIPPDFEISVRNRVAGGDQIVDEIHARFTHSVRMDWLLPSIEPTGRVVEVDAIVVVGLRDGRVAFERLYWDQATVWRQIGRSPE